MAKLIKLVVAGQGAFGVKHLEALQKIPDVQVVSLTGGNQQQTEEVAKKFGIPHWTGNLAEIGRHVADAETLRHLLRRLQLAADERDDLDAVDVRERFEVLDAERTGAGERELHHCNASSRLLATPARVAQHSGQ